METYAVGFARPDRWSQPGVDGAHPWHAVAAHRPAEELDGEVELALCGAIVQVWGSQQWSRVGGGRTACAECRRLSAPSVREDDGRGDDERGNEVRGNVAREDDVAREDRAKAGGRRLRVVS